MRNIYPAELDYCKFTGQLVDEQPMRLWSWVRMQHIMRMCIVIDIGKPDTVPPVSGEELLAPEMNQPEPELRQRKSSVDIRRLLIAYLREHGPSVAADIEAGTGIDRQVAQHAMHRHNDLFERLGKREVRPSIWANVWGLK